MTRLLDGIRVIDAANFIAGPVSTTIMVRYGSRRVPGGLDLETGRSARGANGADDLLGPEVVGVGDSMHARRESA
jgi:hypothetical protein